MEIINFNEPTLLGNEIDYIKEAIENNKKISGDGIFTKKCNEILQTKLNTKKALLTNSCTAALEMAALLLNIKEGDEVICPSFTFVTSASAFALRGAKIVFVDIKKDTLNLDEDKIEEAITQRTKAIVVVHYAGVSCNMEKINEISIKYNIPIVEDAAQAIGSFYKNKPCGSIGDFGCFSFHETKNIVCGEGGALTINYSKYIEKAEIIREKGTNRSKFFRGQVDKYTWVDLGSSYLPSEIVAAYLYSQLENLEKINNKRLEIWNKYNNFFKDYEKYITRPVIPDYCKHNAHIYYVLFDNLEMRNKFIDFMKKNNILVVFHYIPLHSSPAGMKYGRSIGNMNITNKVSDTLVRLPLFYNLTTEKQEYIFKSINNFFKNI